MHNVIRKTQIVIKWSLKVTLTQGHFYVHDKSNFTINPLPIVSIGIFFSPEFKLKIQDRTKILNIFHTCILIRERWQKIDVLCLYLWPLNLSGIFVVFSLFPSVCGQHLNKLQSPTFVQQSYYPISFLSSISRMDREKEKC